jgi:hypothetical protein
VYIYISISSFKNLNKIPLETLTLAPSIRHQ